MKFYLGPTQMFENVFKTDDNFENVYKKPLYKGLKITLRIESFHGFLNIFIYFIF